MCIARSMHSVTSQISIRGSIAHVFDLATTAGLWPQWHPATLAVDGVTERPMALGDAIIERGGSFQRPALPRRPGPDLAKTRSGGEVGIGFFI